MRQACASVQRYRCELPSAQVARCLGTLMKYWSFRLTVQNALEIAGSGRKVRSRRRHTMNRQQNSKRPAKIDDPFCSYSHAHDPERPPHTLLTAQDGVSRYCKFISSSFTSICRITPQPVSSKHFQDSCHMKTVRSRVFCCCWMIIFFRPSCTMTWFILFAQCDHCLSTEESILNINTGWHFKSYLKCHQSQNV